MHACIPYGIPVPSTRINKYCIVDYYCKYSFMKKVLNKTFCCKELMMHELN